MDDRLRLLASAMESRLPTRPIRCLQEVPSDHLTFGGQWRYWG